MKSSWKPSTTMWFLPRSKNFALLGWQTPFPENWWLRNQCSGKGVWISTINALTDTESFILFWKLKYVEFESRLLQNMIYIAKINRYLRPFTYFTWETTKSTESAMNGSWGPSRIPVKTYRFSKKEGVQLTLHKAYHNQEVNLLRKQHIEQASHYKQRIRQK